MHMQQGTFNSLRDVDAAKAVVRKFSGFYRDEDNANTITVMAPSDVFGKISQEITTGAASVEPEEPEAVPEEGTEDESQK